jgi:hypothetical protein
MFCGLWMTAGTAAAQSDSQPIAELSISDLRIQNFATDRFQFGGRVLIRAKEKAEIQRVSFNGVTFAGTPVFIAPMEQKFELQPGSLTLLPGEIEITVYFRDVDPAALERALSSPDVHIEGTSTVVAELSLFQSVAMMRRTVNAQMRFSGNAPLTFPGGTLTREAALLAVRAIKPVYNTAREAVSPGGIIPVPLSWNDEMLRKHGDSLTYVVSKYQMRDKKGRVYPFTYSCVGFRVSGGEIVVPKEAIRPWEFEPRAILLARNQKAKVIPDGTDVIVFTAGMPIQGSAQDPLNGLRLTARTIRLQREGGSDAETTILREAGGKRQKASVQRRVSLKNFAVLEIADASNLPPIPSPATDLEASKPYWDRVAVFRASVAPGGGMVKYEAISARVRRNGSLLVMEDPVDHSALGSPVVIGSGVIAIVLDERGGAMFREAMSANGYRATAPSQYRILAASAGTAAEAANLNRSLQ